MNFDINSVRIVMTVVSFLIFIGIVAWALDPRKKSQFQEAAQYPLLED